MINLRRYTFKLYLNTAQAAEMDRQRRMHAQLWNALLQMREDRWRRQSQEAKQDRRGLTYFDQSKDITALVQSLPEWRALCRTSLDRTAQLLDEAFKAFFRRLKAGEKEAGYPRYKRTDIHGTIPFKAMSQGWKFVPKPIPGNGNDGLSEPGGSAVLRRHKRKSSQHFQELDGGNAGRPEERTRRRCWNLTCKGIPGTIRARGKFPAAPLDFRNAEIMFRNGSYWFSVCVIMPVRMIAGHEPVEIQFDLLDKFASVKIGVEGERLPCSIDGFQPPKKQISLDVSGNYLEAPGDPPQTQGDDGRLRSRQRRISPGDPPQTQGDDGCRTSSTITQPGDPPQTQGDDGERNRVAPGDPPQTQGVDGLKSTRDTRYKRGSWRWRELKRIAARRTARTARRTREALHVWTTAIVRQANDLTVTAPPVKDNTRSPRGTARQPGAQVGPVSKLNRNTLSQAPASAVQMLVYKAAEAGIRCDVIADAAPKIAVGADLVTTGKTIRRARRKLKQAA